MKPMNSPTGPAQNKRGKNGQIVVSVPENTGPITSPAAFLVLNAYVLRFAIDWFQLKAIPSVKEAYR
ncbi:MAG: hypothetical protein AAF399_20160, partial [Bacteroidota bacterium]